jgi:hypothetical protein
LSLGNKWRKVVGACQVSYISLTVINVSTTTVFLMNGPCSEVRDLCDMCHAVCSLSPQPCEHECIGAVRHITKAPRRHIRTALNNHRRRGISYCIMLLRNCCGTSPSQMSPEEYVLEIQRHLSPQLITPCSSIRVAQCHYSELKVGREA